MNYCHCGAPVKCRGLCADHYLAYYRSPEFTPAVRVPVAKPPCTVPGCDRGAKSRGLCPLHYAQQWRQSQATACKPGHRRHTYSKRGTCIRCGAGKRRNAAPQAPVVPCTVRQYHYYGDNGACVHCGVSRVRALRVKPVTERKPLPVPVPCTRRRHEYGEDGLCVHCEARRMRQPPAADAALRVRYT